MSSQFTQQIPFPELVFGLVGPIGVDLEYVQTTVEDALKSLNYIPHTVHLTKVMRDIETDICINETDAVASYETKIDYANALREKYRAKEFLAALAIGAIRTIRTSQEQETKGERGKAYIVRQLKTPEEVHLLRAVYGRQYIQVSIYGSPLKREDYLNSKIKIRSSGMKSEKEARAGALRLIERDQKEDNDFGQNTSEAFPLGDVFVDSSDRETVSSSIERFMNALFGSNEISPTRDEYGIYLAKSASLRSCDLSRQVGAAVFSGTGEVISLGSNEVPRAGGGTYWTGDPNDSRDIRQGHDPNEINKVEIFAELISRLAKDRFLNPDLLARGSTREIIDTLLAQDSGRRYRDIRIMDILEFGRIIHAEMSAICDAARIGNAVKGATLYCTTFPCHLCAKHIVASGIKRVVYLEPYPKSYAKQLHSDSIQVEDRTDELKVTFQPFIGIAPLRYRQLFEKGRRKDQTGEARKWKSEPRRPILDIIVPAYREAEGFVTAELARIIAEKETNEGGSE